MSVLAKLTVDCPACNAPVSIEGVASINADRRPDLRQAILAGTLQAATCAACGKAVRGEPELMLLDTQRDQWLLVRPAAARGEWREVQREAESIFDRLFTKAAMGTTRAIGARLSARVVFGWPALAEKLALRDAGIDDVAMECLKAWLLRGGEAGNLGDHADLRFVTLTPDGGLVLGWVPEGAVAEPDLFEVPRAAIAAIEADPTAWKGLRDALGTFGYVDLRRVIDAA